MAAKSDSGTPTCAAADFTRLTIVAGPMPLAASRASVGVTWASAATRSRAICSGRSCMKPPRWWCSPMSPSRCWPSTPSSSPPPPILPIAMRPWPLTLPCGARGLILPRSSDVADADTCVVGSGVCADAGNGVGSASEFDKPEVLATVVTSAASCTLSTEVLAWFPCRIFMLTAAAPVAIASSANAETTEPNLRFMSLPC